MFVVELETFIPQPPDRPVSIAMFSHTALKYAPQTLSLTASRQYLAETVNHYPNCHWRSPLHRLIQPKLSSSHFIPPANPKTPSPTPEHHTMPHQHLYLHYYSLPAHTPWAPNPNLTWIQSILFYPITSHPTSIWPNASQLKHQATSTYPYLTPTLLYPYLTLTLLFPYHTPTLLYLCHTPMLLYLYHTPMLLYLGHTLTLLYPYHTPTLPY